MLDAMDCTTTSGFDSQSSSSSSSSSVLSLSQNTPMFIPPDNQTITPQTKLTNDQQPKAATKTKLPSSKYKGVVPQTNGRWGAQLYDGHKRVWLGTFNHQDQAATAHDLAAIRFRGVHAAVNFSAHHYVSRPHHLEFLAAHSMIKIVAMLRTHTYEAELARFMRPRIAANSNKRPPGQDQVLLPNPNPVPKKRLFEKVLTASDVGKGTLHRLVVPKCHAERDLPVLKCDKGMMLTFEDGGGERVWRFKYCYWKGSKNYVLTKGWSHFVREKGLKPGDVVAFYTSASPNHDYKRLYIDSSSGSGSILSPTVVPLVDESSPSGNNGGSGSSDVSNGSGSRSGPDTLRLFGVDIRVEYQNWRYVEEV